MPGHKCHKNYHKIVTLIAPLHEKLLVAQKSLFESELFDEISREAREKESIGVLSMFERQMSLEVNDHFSLLVKLVEQDPERERREKTALENLCLTAEMHMRKVLMRGGRGFEGDPILEELNVSTSAATQARKKRLMRPHPLEVATQVIKQYLCCSGARQILDLVSRNLRQVPTSLRMVTRGPLKSLIHFSVRGKTYLTFEATAGVLKVLLPNQNVVQVSLGDLLEFVLQILAESVVAGDEGIEGGGL